MDWLSSFISNPDVLTPLGVFEIFGLFMIIELIGMMFSWTRGRNY
jgi:hypothetical protein